MQCAPRRHAVVDADNLPVYCSGRWGPRRVRVEECTVMRAEDVYSALLHDTAGSVAPGQRGTASFPVADHAVTAAWEIRPNSVWRHGRVFLRCPRCAGRCTRLYLPRADAGLACRRCWGLTYSSRTQQNYKDTIWGRGRLARVWDETQREHARRVTFDKREECRQRSRDRWAERRRYVELTP